MLILLLVIIILFLYLAYYLMGHDIFSPPCLICETFIISISFCLYNWESWKLWKYSADAAFIILIGIMSYIGGCFSSYIIFEKKRNFHSVKYDNLQLKKKNQTYLPIQISNVILIIVLLFECVVCILYFASIRNIASGYGYGGSLSSILSGYNSLLTNNMLDVEAGGSFFVRQSVKVCFILGLLSIAIIINNIIADKFRMKYFLLILIALISVVLSVLGSARINIFKYVTFAITVYNFVYHRKYGWNKLIRLKTIFKVIVTFALLLFLFTSMRSILGRGLRFDPLYYISVYAGGSIKLFDIFIESGSSQNSIVGQETFYGFLDVLHRYGLITDPYKRLEFRSFEGYFVGNVYTVFRRYYNDFGMIGMILISLILGFVIMTAYNQCKKGKRMLSLIDLRLMIFGILSWGMYLFSIDECILSTILTVLYVTYVVIMLVLWYLLNNVRLSHGKIILKKKILTLSNRFPYQ